MFHFLCRQTNTKYSAATAHIKKTISDWLDTFNAWPSDEQFESFRVSSFPPPCPTFYKQGCTPRNTLIRLHTVSLAVRLRQNFPQQALDSLWNTHKQRLLPLAKASENNVVLRQCSSLLKLPAKEIDKYWHKKKCEWIAKKGEGYRLGLTNCDICNQSMVKIIGGKCTLPGHKDIALATKLKREKDAANKKRANEKPRDVICKKPKCTCTAEVNPVTKK